VKAEEKEAGLKKMNGKQKERRGTTNARNLLRVGIVGNLRIEILSKRRRRRRRSKNEKGVTLNTTACTGAEKYPRSNTATQQTQVRLQASL